MRPTPFTSWTHRKGGHYTVLGIDPNDVVVYVAHSDRELWQRPLSEFCDGRFRPSPEPALLAPMIAGRG